MQKYNIFRYKPNIIMIFFALNRKVLHLFRYEMFYLESAEKLSTNNSQLSPFEGFSAETNLGNDFLSRKEGYVKISF